MGEPTTLNLTRHQAMFVSLFFEGSKGKVRRLFALTKSPNLEKSLAMGVLHGEAIVIVLHRLLTKALGRKSGPFHS